ncbi:hypothetical protein QQX98_009943 [Neonectria punicea]|uniref:HNH nuclease domain-containing protein n=1 Tax=Neonectria punicea TaxID=979145 RepID=A0ABR1GR11_9HYPO
MLRRPPPAAPKPRALAPNKISFHHPGYSRPVNVLFCLPRVDPSPGRPGEYGVHARTALVACQIVANNAFAGYLAADEKGTRRIEIDPRAVLTESDYWFFVDGDDQYPIVPSFCDWEFPHGRLPSYWQLSIEESSAASNRCHITRANYAVTGAHCIPKEEGDWFALNGMHRYSSGRGDTENPGNIIPLKSDVHACLDLRECAFVPKPDEAGEEAPALHVLNSSFPDFAELFHNSTLMGNYVCGEYLLARFAWAVIQQVKPFVTEGFQRRIARFGRVSTDDDPMPPGKQLTEATVDWLKGDLLREQYGGGGSKRASQTKGSRKRKAGDQQDNDDGSDSGGDSVNEDGWYAEHLQMIREGQNRRTEVDEMYEEHLAMILEREHPRGRKRARLSDQSFTTNVTTPPLSYSSAADRSGSSNVPDSPKSEIDLRNHKLEELPCRGKAGESRN